MPIDFGRDVRCLLGIPLDMVDAAGALERMRAAAAARTTCFVSTPNLNFLITCQGDADFRDAVIQSDLSVADGMPLVWLARLLGMPVRERVAGSTLFEALRNGAARQLSVYFFGGPAGVAAESCRRLNAEGRGLRCAGFRYPGMGSVDEMSSDEVIADINASGADFLVVALGARKGQEWIVRNLPRLTVPLISHLGAVVNFVAGTVSRAPAWMQRSGLEWLWRIKEEPGLWHRYFDDGLAMLSLLVTCVLPHALHRWLRASAKEAAPGRLVRMEEGDAVVLLLHGRWEADNLAPLRSAFAAAGDTAGALRLDLSGVDAVDSAFIGLVLLLHGLRSRSGLPLTIVGVRGDAARVFRWCRAEFVLADEKSAPAGRR